MSFLTSITFDRPCSIKLSTFPTIGYPNKTGVFSETAFLKDIEKKTSFHNNQKENMYIYIGIINSSYHLWNNIYSN